MRERPLILPILLFTILLCTIAWFFADMPTALFFSRFRYAPWMGIWETITLAGQSELYLAGGALIWALFRNGNRRASLSGLFLFASTAVSGLLADLVKLIAGRARPKLLVEQGIYGFDGFHFEHAWTSFPSGHSATGLSVAVTLSLLFPRYRLLFISVGLLIAASRVVLAQHYLSDVAAGSMLGVATAFLLYQRYFKHALDEVRTA